MSLTHRHFTIEEAQALVSWLRETFEAMAPLLERNSQLREQIEALLDRTQHNGGGDVDAQLSRALEYDSLFEAPELTEKRDCLHRNNPPCFKALLNLLEGDVPFRETSPAAQKG